MPYRVGVNLLLEEIRILKDMLDWSEIEEKHERDRVKGRILGAEYFSEVVKKIHGWRENIERRNLLVRRLKREVRGCRP